MRKKGLIVKTMVGLMLASTLMAGCGKKEESKKDETTKAVVSSTTDETTTVSNETEAPTETETPTESQEETTAEVDDLDWETAKVSGSLEAYEKYFKVDQKEYKQAVDAKGEMNEITYHSEVVNADRDAYVYTPAGYNTDTEYPVIYLIHGLGCDDGQWPSLGIAKIFDYMIANEMVKPFVAVCPSVIPADGLTKNSFSEENIQAFADFVKEYKEDLAPFMKENYSVSEKREDTAICGLSMGGMDALRVGFSHLDRFGYIGSFSAAPTLEMELLTTEGSEYVPYFVLICSGDADGTVGDNPKNYHEELTKNGVDHIWYQHPGGGHDGNVWAVGLINFLKGCFTE